MVRRLFRLGGCLKQFNDFDFQSDGEGFHCGNAWIANAALNSADIYPIKSGGVL